MHSGFRPCIDLHDGKVKQIVGSSLSDNRSQLHTNFVSAHDAAYYADMYRRDKLGGGHVIMLGSGNDKAARQALSAYPGGLQIGGGINAANAEQWLDWGASHVIVTSWIFQDGELDMNRLRELSDLIGPSRLVLDLSCRWKDNAYYIVTERWQRFSHTVVNAGTLDALAEFCAEFLIHAVDVEGKQGGIDSQLIQLMANESPIPCVYAGGISSFDDIDSIRKAGDGRVAYTIGSALDIFGGSKLKYSEVIDYERQRKTEKP